MVQLPSLSDLNIMFLDTAVWPYSFMLIFHTRVTGRLFPKYEQSHLWATALSIWNNCLFQSVAFSVKITSFTSISDTIFLIETKEDRWNLLFLNHYNILLFYQLIEPWECATYFSKCPCKLICFQVILLVKTMLCCFSEHILTAIL